MQSSRGSDVDVGGARRHADAGEQAPSPPGNAAPAAPPGDGAGAESGTDELNQELARIEDRYKRALADLDNYRKRASREVDRRASEVRESTIRDWLDVVDSVERAIQIEPQGPCREGLQAVMQQIDSVLAREGVTRTGAPGEEFDPERHDAVATRRRRRHRAAHGCGGPTLRVRARRSRDSPRAGRRRARARAAPLMAVAYQDYYEALGVPRDASEQDIRSAYRKLAREHHPDVNKEPGAEDRFKQISEAYEVLRDKDKRERYDRLGANWKAGQDASGARGGGYEEAFRGGDGFSDVRVDFGGGDFSDFFESFFGGQGARAGAGGGQAGANGFALRGADQEATLELTLEEAAAGGKRRLSLGDGRDFDVEIPRGVRAGQRIRLAGQGEPGSGGGCGR